MDRLKELKAKLAKEGKLSDTEAAELKKLEAEHGDKVEEVTETEVNMSPEVMAELKTAVGEIVDEKVSAAVGAIEKTVTKKVGGSVVTATKEQTKAQAAKNFVKQIKAFMDHDYETVRKMNAENIEAQIKAGYMNEGTAADGGNLVPPADFIAEVARLEQQYGVARRNARVRTTNSNSVIMPKKSSGVTMYETGEGVTKTGTKMAIGTDTVTLRKFAAIAALTDELVEDSAVDVFNELAIDFARETARIEDVLVFTDATTGILNVGGTVPITSGTYFDLLNQAVLGVPSDSARGGKFYLNRQMLSKVQTARDLNGNYLWKPGVDGPASATIWGYAYEIVEVMPNDTAIFGNLQFVTLIEKRGLDLTRLTEGTVHDAAGNAINLAEQDMKALRAVKRVNAKVQFPGAFAVVTGGYPVS